MAEYIKREDALDAALFSLVGTGHQSQAIYAIRDVPTADVVEVVRCNDCKHNADNGGDCDRVLIHTHRNLVTETNEYLYFKLNYCEYGTPKERGREK